MTVLDGACSHTSFQRRWRIAIAVWYGPRSATRQRRWQPPKRPSHALARTTRALTRTNGCTETGEKLKEAATLNCLHQATTCGCIASCVPALCAVCRSAFGPEQVRNCVKVTFASHKRKHTSFFFFFSFSFLQLHHSSNSRLVRLIRYFACPLSFWASIPDPRPGCCRFRHPADAQLDADADVDAHAHAHAQADARTAVIRLLVQLLHRKHRRRIGGRAAGKAQHVAPAR